MTLKFRINSILIIFVLIALIGGLFTIWYSYHIELLLNDIMGKDISALKRAESLTIALVNQKGYVSYYFLDKDPNWLKLLGEFRQIFQEKLDEIKVLLKDENELKTIQHIENEYIKYKNSKDKVVELFNSGNSKNLNQLNKEVRNHFFEIIRLCDEYKNFHQKQMRKSFDKTNKYINEFRFIILSVVLVELFLIVFMGFLLANNILKPLKKLTLEVNRKSGKKNKSENEIKELSSSIRGLIKDANITQSELERSRESLLQIERMAVVGKLAANMAHSIRNPFTSVKMRLFSLSRSLELDETQKDDMKVISEEIRHIDTIVQNFLEFSKPPKLKMHYISPSTVVGNVLQLLSHRLKSYDVNIKLVRKYNMSKTYCDPEQLKEVLVNLIINACEAIKKDGCITIIEEEIDLMHQNKAIFIKISDNGPGIPEIVREKIFQPFFTTKEEGTGLGLSIAMRIIEEHKGKLEVISSEGNGATFIITLPVTTS